MSDALPIPSQPSADRYKKLAKDLQDAAKSSDDEAVRRWAGGWVKGPGRQAERMEWGWKTFKQMDERAGRCTLAGARLFLARVHGFASWAKFVKFLEAMASKSSPVSMFEAAVEAIISGKLTGLEKLLRKNPKLVRARSMREHGSTLLHYVSANGVEDFRQKTPGNIVEITSLLLHAGAAVNAESNAYGGRSTTLGLTATSCHPEYAGVQLALLELLLGHGALIDGPDGRSTVNSCLHNGRGKAAEFLAHRGARLDLEGAAGTGQLEMVQSFFRKEGRLKPSATRQQMLDGFSWACEFGRTDVVDYLLQRGMKVDARLRPDGQTGLHWAAYEGQVETVKLLLRNGAAVDIKDRSYVGTALGWALYAWGAPERTGRDAYYEVVALLAQAGAKLNPEWYEGDGERQRAVEKLRSDRRMMAALGGQ